MAHCTKPYLTTRKVYFCVVSVVILSTIPMIYKFIQSVLQAKIQDSWSKNKYIHYTGLAFIFLTFASLFTSTLEMAYICTDHRILDYLHGIHVLFYLFSTYFLLLLSYIRIYLVFKDTIVPLSRCTTRFRIVIFSVLAIFIIASVITVIIFDLKESSFLVEMIGYLLTSLSFVLIILLSIMTMILFIRKLKQAFRNLSDDDVLIALITQLSILTIISVSITILVPFLLIIDRGWLFDFMIVFDIATNFHCIMLTFDQMNGYYMSICGFCDSKCRKLWKNKVITKDETILSEMAVSPANDMNTEITV